jgi:hypothetical protein
MKRRRDKYYEQTDDYSCVPVAIINALHHKGELNSEIHSLENIKEKCHTTCEEGTKDEWSSFVIPKLLKVKRSVSFRNVKKSLEKGKSMILSYPHHSNTSEGHCIFIDSNRKKIINGVEITKWNDLHNHIMNVWGEKRQRRLLAWVLD